MICLDSCWFMASNTWTILNNLSGEYFCTGIYHYICIELHITVMFESRNSSVTEINPKFDFISFHGTVHRAKNIMKQRGRQGKQCRGKKKEFRFEETICTVLFYLYLSLFLRERSRFNERSWAFPQAMFFMVSQCVRDVREIVHRRCS
jgi:hypothetical protein